MKRITYFITLALAVSLFNACAKKAEQPKQAPEVAEEEAAGFTASSANTQDLFKAIKSGTVAEIAKLLGADVDVNALDSEGNTPLYNAVAYNGNPDIIKMLIDAGAKAKFKDKNGASILLIASGQAKHYSVIKYLVDAGADPNFKTTPYGRTALITAAPTNTNTDIFLELITAGADVNAKTAEGLTALDYATQSNPNPEVIRILLKYGAVPTNYKELAQNIKYNHYLAGKGLEKDMRDFLKQHKK